MPKAERVIGGGADGESGAGRGAAARCSAGPPARPVELVSEDLLVERPGPRRVAVRDRALRIGVTRDMEDPDSSCAAESSPMPRHGRIIVSFITSSSEGEVGAYLPALSAP